MFGSLPSGLLALVPVLSFGLNFSPEIPEGADTGTGSETDVETPEPDSAVFDSATHEAARLFDAGQAKYDTHDYAGAIVDFTAAYDLAANFADAERRDEALARLAFNLARAHVYAHDLDHDARHLGIARQLLGDYRGHERAQGRDPDADTDVTALELDLREREQAIARDQPRDEPPDRRAKARRRAGIGLLAITPAFAGLAVAGGVLGAQAKDEFEADPTGAGRLDARSRGRVGDVLFGVGVGLTAVSAIAGITLVAVRGNGQRETKTLAVRLQPTGLMVEGRF